jgi:hypothetical protein
MGKKNQGHLIMGNIVRFKTQDEQNLDEIRRDMLTYVEELIPRIEAGEIKGIVIGINRSDDKCEALWAAESRRDTYYMLSFMKHNYEKQCFEE